MVRVLLVRSYGAARKIAIGVIGGTIVALGVVMIVLPGPAILVIPFGLAVLGVEFAWARSWLHELRARSQGAAERLRRLRTA